MPRETIGELEHLILLGILGLADDATALALRRSLGEEGRSLSRGALYRSLDRLGEKGLIDWTSEPPSPERGGHARRVYAVTDEGRGVVLERRATLERLWRQARAALDS